MDSSGFSISTYKDWTNAKYGNLSVKDFVKLHIIHTPHGKICAATVTKGDAHDSPMLPHMLNFLPPGTGDLRADSAYGSNENCDVIRETGRIPIISPKKNYVIKGSGARADMLRSLEAHLGTFYKKLSIRNNVERRK